MKTKLLSILFCCWVSTLPAQSLVMESGKVTFSLQAPAGKLEATDSSISGKIMLKEGTVMLQVEVSGFHFVSGMMPDYINASTTKRFHQYYMETEQYPQATYKGNILNLSRINFSRNGVYTIQTKGVLTLHGVNKEISCKGKITVSGTKVYLDAGFEVRPEEHKIRKPTSLGGFYFEVVKLKVHAELVKG